MWLSTLKISAVQCTAAPLQKLRRNHRSFVSTEALSGMVFMPAQRYSVSSEHSLRVAHDDIFCAAKCSFINSMPSTVYLKFDHRFWFVTFKGNQKKWRRADCIQAPENLNNIFGFYANPTPWGKRGQPSSHLPEISSPVQGLNFFSFQSVHSFVKFRSLLLLIDRIFLYRGITKSSVKINCLLRAHCVPNIKTKLSAQ